METTEATRTVTPPLPKGKRTSEIDVVTHTGLGTVAGEYMRRFWHPVLLSEELKTGCAMPVHFLGELFTLYRGSDGVAHALEGRCAHRSVQLSVGTVEQDTIRCLYHGWRYDPSGQCVERPAEKDPNACTNIRIRSYRVHETLGLIFLFAGTGDEPSRPKFPEFEDPGVIEAYAYERGCNFFQNIDNGVDEAHLPFVHQNSFFDVLNYSVPEISAKETDYGLIQYAKRSDEVVHQAYFLMPNMLTFVYPASDDPAVEGWARYLSWRVPIDDNRHRTFIVEHFVIKAGLADDFRRRRAELRDKIAALPPRAEVTQEILSGKSRLSDHASRPDYVLLGDDVAQCAQGVIQDRSTERLGRSDIAVAMARRIWVRELKALESGGDLKSWVIPDRLPRPHTA